MPPFSQILLDPRHPLHLPVLLTLGILLVALPAWFCPLIPFVDLISFAAIHSYPAVQSYGPDHYYTFQFTYILPHILSRAMTGFGVSLAAQVWLLHTAEVAGVFTAILLLLRDYVRSPLVYLPGAILGAVAFIDGMHVWGGPLAFTATAIPFGITLWYLMRSLRTGEAPPTWPLIAAAFLGMLSHPYIGPCLAGLYILYLLLGGRGRLPLLLLTAFLAAYLLLISRDSPEAPDAAAYRGIFGLSHIATNFKNFFLWNTEAARFLSGAEGPLLTLLFHLVEAVKFAGLLGLPLLWPEIRARRDLLILVLVSLAAWITYLLAGQPGFMSLWPQRILVLGAVPMFVLGILVFDRLLARFPRLASANPRLPIVAAAALGLLLAFAQRPLFTLAPAVLDLFERTRTAILATGAHDALIDAPLHGSLRPVVFYAIPYMLFSDHEIVARKLAVYTNWHTWPRHNTRIPEMQRPTGQARYQLLFDAPDPARPRFYQPRFTFQDAAASSSRLHFSLELTLPATPPAAGPGQPLVTTGASLDANFVYLDRLSARSARVCVDRWGGPSVCSPPVPITPGEPWPLEITLTPDVVEASAPGLPIWRSPGPTRSLAKPVTCANPVGGTTARPAFDGLCRAR